MPPPDPLPPPETGDAKRRPPLYAGFSLPDVVSFARSAHYFIDDARTAIFPPIGMYRFQVGARTGIMEALTPNDAAQDIVSALKSVLRVAVTEEDNGVVVEVVADLPRLIEVFGTSDPAAIRRRFDALMAAPDQVTSR